jgi:hypothetical protein
MTDTNCNALAGRETKTVHMSLKCSTSSVAADIFVKSTSIQVNWLISIRLDIWTNE